MFSGQDHGLNRKPGEERDAWPDWWTDGFGASAMETATIRLASSSLIANEAGLSMVSNAGVKLSDEINKCIALADNALLFYTEHTLWYSESVREALSQPTMEQRALKDLFKNQLKVLVR